MANKELLEQFEETGTEGLSYDELLDVHSLLMEQYEDACSAGNVYQASTLEKKICKLEDYLN